MGEEYQFLVNISRVFYNSQNNLTDPDSSYHTKRYRVQYGYPQLNI